MARYTDRWGLSILGPGDALSRDGYKAVDADRRLIDRLLKYAAEDHRHTGITGQDRTPSSPLNLTRESTGGNMPAGARYYYRFTVIDDDGNESAPSPVQPIDMPAPVTVPQAPSATVLTGSGTLRPGTYSYVLSAYKDTSGLETKATNSTTVLIPGSATAPSVSIGFPTLPLGSDGFNVYRKSPNGMHYLYIDTIASPSPGDTWVDDGATPGDCDRSLPAANRTSNMSAVLIAYPGATPSIPDGWSWRIYRSQRPTDWANSYLVDVVPIGATPYTPVSYLDVGSATRIGAPPSAAQIVNAPSKIELTDAAEVTGYLPPGLLAVPYVVTFTWPGVVELVTGTFTWVCDFAQAEIIHCRAYLGVNSEPAAFPVVVDVNALRPSQGSDVWESIYADGPGRPQVPVDQNIGATTVPVIQLLRAGDSLSVDIDQTGGGATPTDRNLTVNIFMYVKYGSETDSYGWAS